MNKTRFVVMLVVVAMPAVILSSLSPVAGLVQAVIGCLLVAALYLISEAFS